MVWTQGWTSEETESGIVIADGSAASEPSVDLKELLFTLSDEDCESMRANFAWNIDEFIAPVLKLLKREELKELVKEHWLKVPGFGKLQYIPGKILGVYEGRSQPVLFYSLDQYFPEVDDPKDANMIWALADILVKTLNGMGIYAKSYTSPAKIYEQGVLDHCEIPTADDVPDGAEECVKYAWHCAGKTWIECLQIGHFDRTFDFDQTSAYPYQMTKLQNTKYAKYQKSSTMIENADWGFLRGRVTINPEVKVHPITHRLPDGSIINPGGSWDEWLTLDAVRFIYKWSIGTFKLYDGWFLTFMSPQKPLEIVMKRLFAYRGQKDLRDQLAKRMANGAIGKFLEEHKGGSEFGQYYNPLYGAMVQERTRLEVGRFIYVNKLWNKDIVSVNTDGVLSTKDVGMKLDRPKVMGKWRLADIGPALAESSGNVFHSDKRPHGITYDALMDALEEKPNESFYGLRGTRLVTIRDIIDNKADWNELGKPKTFATSSVDLVKLLAMNKTKTLDRVYEGIPQTGKELLNNHYTSEPIILS